MGKQYEDSSEDTTEERPVVISVARALSILDCLGESKDMLGITELGRALGLHKSTVYRLVSTLTQYGYVEQDRETDKYRLGMRLIGLGTSVLDQIDLREVSRPYLQELMEITGETIHLGVLEGNQVMYLDKIDSKQVLTMKSRIGAKVPVHCTALGKVLTASLPRERFDQVMASCEWVRYTHNTITNMGEFGEHLARVREQGYAMDDEEHEVGIRCIAAPIRDHKGTVVAAASASGPTIRLTREQAERFIPNLLSISRSISLSLGCDPEDI